MQNVICYPPSSSNEAVEIDKRGLRSASFSSQISLPRVPVLTAQSNQQSHLSSTHSYCIATLTGHTSYIFSLTLAGKYLYSGSLDNEIRAWKRNPHNYEAGDESLADNVVALTKGSADKKIKVWQKLCGDNKHTAVCTLEMHSSGINALALSPDGSLLYSGACDRSILVWEKRAHEDGMELLGALRGHTKAILCLATVDDLLFSGSADKTIRVWRRIGGSYCCSAVLEGHQGPVKCLTAAVDPYGTQESVPSSCYLLYSGSLDCDIRVWHVIVPQ